ncbi:MAG: sugar ABC transporter substrate-binding protein [Lachnospiraceae bacterium]|nr:sugar ABC transporter substrate-binding protein [Lachnospiraceae bacterium]
MNLKSKLIATAAVIIMAAAAIYGSTFSLNVEEEVQDSISWFGNKETIYFWYSDDTMTNYINSAAVAFGEREGVRVIPILTSDSEYLEAVNRETLHSEQMPDVYLLSNDSLEKAYLAGLASEVMDSEGVCTETNFPKAALDAVAYEGKTIAYPMYFETSALVYNKTYLEAWAKQQAEKEIAGAVDEGDDSGMTEPVDGATLDQAEVEAKALTYMQQAIPATVEDILNIANTFDVPEGVEGVMKWDVSDIFYNYWIVGDYMIVGGDAGDNEQYMNINNPETIQCLEVYKGLNQFFFIESDTVTYESVVQDFIDGKTVFTIVTTDVLARLQQAKEDGSFAYEYGIATMPEVSRQLQSRSLSVTNAVVINGYSEHKALANEFAAYLTGEYSATLYDRTGKMSANLHADTDNQALQTFFMEYAESVSLPKMMETGNFWLQLEILFSKVWNGEDVTMLVQELADGMTVLIESAPS